MVLKKLKPNEKEELIPPNDLQELKQQVSFK